MRTFVCIKNVALDKLGLRGSRQKVVGRCVGIMPMRGGPGPRGRT